jgi:hypothetical protein
MEVPVEIVNLLIFKGTDFEQDIQLSDQNGNVINLTGCTVLAKIQKYPGSKLFNTFTVAYLNRAQGLIRLLMSQTTTLFLEAGRNYFDIFVVYPNNKIKPVARGTILVEETTTAITVEGGRLGDLGRVDTSNLQDGEVLMFRQEEQKLEFVNPDKVLEKAAEDGLPEDFVNSVNDDISNKFNIDLGEY